MKSPKHRTLLYAFILTIGASLLLRLYFSHISLENLPLTSDESSSALLAQMISDGARPLLFIGQPYQFPIESYLFSLFVNLAPASPYGMRLFILFLGLLTMTLLLYCVWGGCKKGERWLPLLLVLFPSYYVLENFSAYTPPQYGIGRLLAVSGIAFVLIFRNKNKLWLLICSGLVSGLAVSNHLLYLSVAVGVGAMVLFQGRRQAAIKELAYFILGFLLGLTPLFAALYLIPGAYSNLPSPTPFLQLPSRLSTVFLHTLPLGLGYKCLIFNDFTPSLNKYLWLQYPLGLGFLALLCIAVFLRTKRALSYVHKKQWPNFEMPDMAIIVTIVSLVLLIRSETVHNSVRYLLPALWIFPFWATYLALYNRYVRYAAAGLLVVLVFFNISTSWALITQWKDRDMLQKIADTPDISTLIADLRNHGIDRCYASFWLAYRINYESNEEIICSMPLNERFPHWSTPFKDEVDSAHDLAYVLSQTPISRLTTLVFMEHLKKHRIASEHFKSRYGFGSFNIFHSFVKEQHREEVPIANTDWAMSTEVSDKAMQQINWMEYKGVPNEDKIYFRGYTAFLDLKEKRHIASISFRYRWPFRSNNFGLIHYYDEDKGWIQASEIVKLAPDKITFRNNHPVYGENFQKITFTKLTPTTRLRIDFITRGRPEIFREVEINVEQHQGKS